MNESICAGDVVKISRGEIVHQERVVSVADNLYFPNFEGQPSINYLEEVGYRVEIISRAAGRVPTEDGFYRDKDGDFWSITDGVMTYFTTGNSSMAPNPAWYVPLTLLRGVDRP